MRLLRRSGRSVRLPRQSQLGTSPPPADRTLGRSEPQPTRDSATPSILATVGPRPGQTASGPDETARDLAFATASECRRWRRDQPINLATRETLPESRMSTRL